jgi:hypothetical protein
VARLLGNQLQHDVAHGACIEHFRTATAAAATHAVMLAMTGVMAVLMM